MRTDAEEMVLEIWTSCYQHHMQMQLWHSMKQPKNIICFVFDDSPHVGDNIHMICAHLFYMYLDMHNRTIVRSKLALTIPRATEHIAQIQIRFL